jgi:hypothetical protein
MIIYQYINVFGLVLSDKIFLICILKTSSLAMWPTYATDRNHLHNFERGPPKGNSCKVWLMSSYSFIENLFKRTVKDNGKTGVTIDQIFQRD